MSVYSYAESLPFNITNANEAQRYLVGTLSNMYIKVGKYQ